MKPGRKRRAAGETYQVRQAENLRRLFVGSCVRYNTKTAFLKKEKGGWTEVGYSSFMDSVDALGTALFRRGLCGAPVVITGENSVEWACVFAAVAGGLGTAFPLPVSYGPEKTVSAALMCGAKALFCDAGMLEEIGGPAADAGLEVFSFDDLPSLIAEGRILLFENETGFVSLDPLPGSAAIYSLCGPEKASVFTHEAVCAAIAGIGRRVQAGPSDRVMNIHPWSGLYSLYFGLLFPVFSGASVVIGKTLGTLAEDMRETSPTFLCAVPGLCSRLYERIIDNLKEKTGGSEERLRALMRLSGNGNAVTKRLFSKIHDAMGGRLRIIFCGPRPGDETALRGLRGLGFIPVQAYGPSGTLPPVAMTGDAVCRDGTAGYAAPGSVIDVFDPEPDGVGRIRFKGPGCPSGFIEAGKGISAAPSDGWYYTGDLGSLDADGCLRVYGPEFEEDN